jgi:hypothetical protein
MKRFALVVTDYSGVRVAFQSDSADECRRYRDACVAEADEKGKPIWQNAKIEDRFHI